MSNVAKPNLAQMRVQAKELLRAENARDQEALRRVRSYFPSDSDFKLSHALLAIAREHGYASWKKLKQDLQEPGSESVKLSNAAFFALIEQGDSDSVKQALADFPEMARAHRRVEYGWESALYAAAEHGHLEIAKVLVEAGAEVYETKQGGYPAIDGAICRKHQNVVDYLLRVSMEQDEGLPPTYGCGIDIVLAARHGWLERVNMHIERDPFAVYRRGCIGETVLHWPAHNGHVQVLEALLDAGAVVEADEIGLYGGKPLHWAAEHAPSCVEALLRRKANPNSLNLMKGEFEGFTPLHMCARQPNQSIKCAELLLSAGCDPTIRDAQGRTAFEVANLMNREAIAHFLARSG